MGSRARRSAFNDWWWTVDRLTLAALAALMLGGIVLCLAASPPVAARIGLDPFHFVDRQVLFLIPAAAVLFGDVVSVAARGPPDLAGGVFRQPRPGRGDALFRRRDQGRAALAGDLRRQYPAVGISEAGFRGPDRVAVRRIRQASGNAGQFSGAGAAHRRGVAARDSARLRPDHADRAGVGRAVSIWRACALSGWSGSPPRPASAC